LWIALIMFVIGVLLAMYTKQRIIYMACGLLFFIPIFEVANTFVIVFSIIMLIICGILAFYDPEKEGFK
jgi:hypothetical protein